VSGKALLLRFSAHRRAVAIAAVVAGVFIGLPGGARAADPPITFAAAVDSPTGGSFGPGPGAETTAVADFDGDGRLDVVVTDLATTTQRALRNIGGGRFDAPQLLPPAYGVLAVGTGEFNGDGRPDVVGRSGHEVVLWTGNGDGTFTLAQRVLSPSNVQQSLAVGDVDLDGRTDVVTTTVTGLQLFRGTGSGLAAGPITLAIGVLSDVAIANLDGDSRPDLVVVDATPLLQRARAYLGVGDGTFTEAGSGSTGYGPEAVSVGDLNHDGFDDAVTSDSFSGIGVPSQFSITVLLSDGHGGFSSGTTYPTAKGPVSGDIGDLNADGHLDVVIAGVMSTGLAVYANDGTGALSAVRVPPVVRAPQTPAIADIDGDGRPDIAVPGVGHLSVLLNRS
jgi:hypothetical protein